jgi:LmbE family N-acetylglucosaminyl deacetylase
VIPMLFGAERSAPLKALFLGAHCDDIEIGCGGTILRLREWYPNLEMRWMVFSSTDERRAETQNAAARFGIVDTEEAVRIERFRDGYLPYEGVAVKEAMHRQSQDFAPHVVFTHFREDRHQDHRVVSDLTWNAFRDHLIFEYEIPKWDGDLGCPNFFVPLDPTHVAAKLAIIEEEYPSQATKGSFALEAFRGLMAVRGLESKSRGGYAEAFYCRKFVGGMDATIAP